MKRLRKQKNDVNRPLIAAASFVFILLALPVMLYLLQQKQTFQQHAQMTPPPAPLGCYYEPVDCSTAESCNPDAEVLVCPNVTLSPSQTPLSTVQQSQPTQQDLFTIIQKWLKNLF